MQGKEDFREVLESIKRRYGVDINVALASDIESVQEDIRKKTKTYLDDQGIVIRQENGINIANDILSSLDFSVEREKLYEILKTKAVVKDEYVDGLIYQAILQEISRRLMENTAVIENDNNVCPLCGSQSDLGYLREDGSIMMICPFCNLEWKQSTLENPKCPFCGFNDKNLIGVLKDKSNPNVMVFLCPNCKRYWIVIDDRYIRYIPRNLYHLLREKAYKIIGSLPSEYVGKD